MGRYRAWAAEDQGGQATTPAEMDLTDALGRMQAFHADLTIAAECNFWRTRSALFGGRFSDRDGDDHCYSAWLAVSVPNLRDPLTLYER
jgi:hypothetical protein